MGDWLGQLKDDPRPWLLEETNAAVRARALEWLYDRPADDSDVRSARARALTQDPIASILAAQDEEGYWVKPGGGYGPKYNGTVWNVIFLAQLGVEGTDPRIRKACDYIFEHAIGKNGGFVCSGVVTAKTPVTGPVLHCLNGNLLRAMIDFGLLDDERVRGALEWQARSITGEGFSEYRQTGTSGPGFCCAANEKQPCAWGAVKAMLSLAAIPPERREPHVERAIAAGVEFLLSRDPAVADYPFPSYAKAPNSSWFKLGFPSGYVTDVLQNLEALCELGHGGDPKLQHARDLVLSKQDRQGRWKNEYAYHGKTVIDFERQGQPSKWVTLRACRVLRAMSA